MSISIIGVSNMNPSGIQFKNLNKVSNVARINDGFCAFSRISEQSWNISAHTRVRIAGGERQDCFHL